VVRPEREMIVRELVEKTLAAGVYAVMRDA